MEHTKSCPEECSCRKPRTPKPLYRVDPLFKECASSPADARIAETKICKVDKGEYRSFEVWCPFCGRIHVHGGGAVSSPPVYGLRKAHCGKGSYTILPSE